MGMLIRSINGCCVKHTYFDGEKEQNCTALTHIRDFDVRHIIRNSLYLMLTNAKSVKTHHIKSKGSRS